MLNRRATVRRRLSSVQVRSRVAADLPACVRTLARVHAMDGYPSRWPDDPPAWLAAPTQIAAWIATRGETAEAHIALTATVTDPVLVAATGRSVEHLVRVCRLFVDPDARGCGMAPALLSVATEHARGLGLAPVLDVVDDAASAIALYERMGWKFVDRQPADWTMADGSRPLARRYVL